MKSLALLLLLSTAAAASPTGDCIHGVHLEHRAAIRACRLNHGTTTTTTSTTTTTEPLVRLQQPSQNCGRPIHCLAVAVGGYQLCDFLEVQSFCSLPQPPPLR